VAVPTEKDRACAWANSGNNIKIPDEARVRAKDLGIDPRKMYQGELAYSIRLAKQRNVEKLDLLLFQFAKAGKSSRLILSKEPGNVLLRVSYKWAIGYD